MSACPCIEIEFLRVETTSEEKVCISYAAYIFNLFFQPSSHIFQLCLQTATNDPIREAEEGHFPRPVKCEGVGGLFPRDTQHEGEFPYREITTTINNFTSSSSKYLQFLISFAPQSDDTPHLNLFTAPLSPSLFRSRNTFTSRCHFTR